jgi:site-specific DNA-methyltransferase (adenine-specific)
MIKSEDIELGGVCVKVFNEDCLNVLREMPSNSVDSIVSDPPYGISFMAKKWDYDVPSVEVWKEALRVLKPGGHALIACGTRTQHRMVCNIEDAGFEIRDVVSWIYGSGFPKSHNIGKAVDKLQGNEREDLGMQSTHINRPKTDKWDKSAQDMKHSKFKVEGAKTGGGLQHITKGNSPYEGWGTALKPACEFFTLCRKPLSEKTVAANVLKWGTGGINIDGCRVGSHTGRFPANLIHDGSQEVLDLFPETKSRSNKTESKSSGNRRDSEDYGLSSISCGVSSNHDPAGAIGSAARFFYTAKASKKDRNEGLTNVTGDDGVTVVNRNNHPTVKPTALMAYLCRLITPPNGVVLDPYMGSGSTGKAAVREGFSFVGIELDKDYYEIAKARVCS